jgi:serine/threonine-protein kinase
MKGDSERGTRRKSALGLGDTLDPMTASGEVPELVESLGDRRSRPTVLPRLESVAGHSRVIVDGRPRYEQLQTLGSGGVGVVELARDNDIGRNVAVKRLLPEASSPTDVLRFAEEVRTVGLLEHPNITPIHDVGVDDAGAYFFVMKHVEGMTLEAIIQRLAAGDADTHARYTFEARTRIFLGILQALAFAHAKGVVHRDVKPANVMIGACGEVMLMDWGLSTRGASAVDRPDTIVGTPAYMAPEQVYGAEKGDERSDIYSACVLFYELLTLRHYLPAPTNVLETLSAVETHEPVPARFVASPHQTNVPPELSFFVAKGMQKVASERYQSVTEMLAALAAINRGDIPAQCPRTFLKRMTFRAMHFSDAHAAASLILTALAILVFACGLASIAMWLLA